MLRSTDGSICAFGSLRRAWRSLRGPTLPAGTVIGHKTGSSDRNDKGIKLADNDMGFVLLPDGKRYTIAVFIKNSIESDKANADIIARISKAVYDYYNKGKQAKK